MVSKPQDSGCSQWVAGDFGVQLGVGVSHGPFHPEIRLKKLSAHLILRWDLLESRLTPSPS